MEYGQYEYTEMVYRRYSFILVFIFRICDDLSPVTFMHKARKEDCKTETVCYINCWIHLCPACSWELFLSFKVFASFCKTFSRKYFRNFCTIHSNFENKKLTWKYCIGSSMLDLFVSFLLRNKFSFGDSHSLSHLCSV